MGRSSELVEPILPAYGKPFGKRRAGRRAFGIETGLRFSDGYAEDWSIFLEVFSFEVRADPFATAGAGCREKFYSLKFVWLGGQQFLYLLEILCVVGRNFYAAAFRQTPQEIHEIG